MNNWKLEVRDISELKAHEHNPRRMTREQSKALSDSMDRFGLIDRPVINLDNQIIGGHQRISLLKKKKVKQVECWVPDRLMTEAEVLELMLRLNKNTGEWDEDVLFNVFEADLLRDVGFLEKDLLQYEAIGDIPAEDDRPTCPECGQKLKKGVKK